MWAVWRQQKPGASDSHQRSPGGAVWLCNGLTVKGMWQAADQTQMLGAEEFRWILLLEMFTQENDGGHFTVNAFRYTKPVGSSRKGRDRGGA